MRAQRLGSEPRCGTVPHRDERAFDFVEQVTQKADLKKRIETDAGVQAQEQALVAALDA